MIKFDSNAATDAAIKQGLLYPQSRTLSVTIGGTVIPAGNIVADSLNIKSDIMSGDKLVFGGCLPSQLTVRIFNLKYIVSGNIEGAAITASLITVYLDGGTEHTVTQPLFTGFVYSSKTLQKRACSEIIAYDEFYRMRQMKCKDAVSNIFTNSPSALRTQYDIAQRTLAIYDSIYHTDFETQLAADKGFQYELSPLLNIGMTQALFDSYASDDLTVLDVLKAHCELNARFGYIDGSGTLKFTTFYTETSSATDKKPVDEAILYYQNLTFEDFDSAQVMYLSFPFNGNSSVVYGATDNKRYWYISDNIITQWCSSSSAVTVLLTNFWRANTDKNFIFYGISQYRPFEMTTFGEFWLECGDRATATVQVYNPQTGLYNAETVDSFILTREIKGIANLKVRIQSQGSESLAKEVAT